MKKLCFIIQTIVFFLICFNEPQASTVTASFDHHELNNVFNGAWLAANNVDTLKQPVTVSLKRNKVSKSVDNEPKQYPEEHNPEVKPMALFEFQLSIIVLSFGLLIVLIEVFLIKTRRISSEDSIKFITITLIITSTLFLITAGYSNNQIAPAVGLLGTIAGYLLGKINTTKNDEKV
jgi:hypothetical protein